MRRIIFSMLLMVAGTALGKDAPQAKIQPVDWNYFGRSANGMGAINEDFYSRSNIEIIPNGNIKVSTKSISEQDIDKLRHRKQGNDSIQKGIANKLLKHYRPPYAKLNELTKPQMLNLLFDEEAANKSNLIPQSKIIYELNCRDKKIRALSYSFLDTKNILVEGGDEQQWELIAPESNVGALLRLLCVKPS